MPENCDAKALSYVIARHPVYNTFDILYIYIAYICISDIYYILMIYMLIIYNAYIYII